MPCYHFQPATSASGAASGYEPSCRRSPSRALPDQSRCSRAGTPTGIPRRARRAGRRVAQNRQMNEVTITEARRALSALVDQAHVVPVFLTRRNRTVAVIVAPDQLERLQAAAEELADIRAVDLAWKEEARSRRVSSAALSALGPLADTTGWAEELRIERELTDDPVVDPWPAADGRVDS